MPAIAKKTVLSAVLLCASAVAASGLPATAARASASTIASTGAAVAPTSDPGAPASSPPQATNVFREGVSLATWFGPGLFGRHTACGQLLTKQLVGVANRSLPCGTLVAFSYRGNEVIAPVVDRGPYGSLGANWDLTQRAAKLLKMSGTAQLAVKVVGHIQNSPQLGQPAGGSATFARKSTPPAVGPTGGVAA